MRAFTTVPLPNTPTAKRFISDNADTFLDLGRLFRLSRDPKTGLLSDSAIDLAVSTFMAQYPRGKGTAGDAAKRTMYAACHAIQGRASRSRGWKARLSSRNRNIARSAGLDATMLAFPTDGSMVEYPTRNGIDGGVIKTLIGHGMLDGTFEEHRGRYIPHQMWLTDDGMEYQREIASLVDRERRQKSASGIEAGSVAKHADKVVAMITIAGEDTIHVVRPTLDEAVALRDKIVALLKTDALRGA